LVKPLPTSLACEESTRNVALRIFACTRQRLQPRAINQGTGSKHP